MRTLREWLRAPLHVWLTATHLAVLTIPVLLLLLSGQVRAELLRQAGAELLARAPLTARLIERDLTDARLRDPTADLSAIGEATMAVARPQDDEPYPVQIWLVDRHGDVVASTLTHKSPPPTTGLDDALRGETNAEAVEDPHAAWVERMVRSVAPRGSVVVTSPIRLDGAVVGAVILRRRPTPALRWIASGTLPLTALAAIAVFATSLLALWSADQFTRSLRVLTQEASRVADGDLELARALGRPTRSSVQEVHALAVSVQRMAARLDGRLQVLQEVASGVAHELRTPLSTLIGTIELMEDESMSTQDRQRFLRRASEQLDRLRSIVDGVLVLSRAERPGAREPVDLDGLARGFAAEDVQVLPGAGSVSGDPAALRLALDNLVRNGRQHGVVPIRVQGWRTATHAGWLVADQGSAPAAEEAAHLFERFYTTDRTHGIGLGLSIVAAVAEAHGGVVGLEPHETTTFRVTLPAG